MNSISMLEGHDSKICSRSAGQEVSRLFVTRNIKFYISPLIPT